MKHIICTTLILFIIGCQKHKENPMHPPVILEPAISANNLLDLVIEASGQDKLYKATIKYKKNDVEYISTRNGYDYSFEMFRTKKGINYYAKSSNGNFIYNENGEDVSYGSKNSILEQKLIFDNNLMVLPRLFKNDNSINLEILPTENIKNIDYQVLKVNFKNQLPTDVFKNLRIYINPKTLLPQYISYAYGDDSPGLLWTEYIEDVVIEGVTFYKFSTYSSSSRTTNHKEIVSFFNTNALELIQEVKFTDWDLQLIK